jgi:hypothetical protein
VNTPRFLVIVRQGQGERFTILANEFARDPVLIVWDRRTGERRRRDQVVSAERRLRDRRGDPSATWTALGYVVVDGDPRRPGPRQNA